MNRRQQSGQALALAAVALVVLAGFTGLAIDMGALRYERRLQQTAADSGAIAGAQNLQFGSGVTAGAQYAATQNGFTDGGTSAVSPCDPSAGSTPAIGTTCVQVNYPPVDVSFNGGTIPGGPHARDAKYVEVIVAKIQPTYFMNIFGVASQPVIARAVATNIAGGANSDCLYTLGPPTAAIIGLDATGNARILAPHCGVADNGNLDTTGNSYTIQASTLSVSGSCIGSHCGSPDVVCTSSPGGTCPPIGGAPATQDPFKGLLPPPMPAYSRSCPTPYAAPCDWSSSAGQVATIEPGTYNSISLGSNSTITMEPGIYYINGSLSGSGAGINFSGGATLVSQGYLGGTNPCGTSPSFIAGVMIYFTGTSTMNKFVGGGNNPDLRLCPMNSTQSSTYAGILMFQDPNDTATAFIAGDNNTVLNGTIYMPTATLTYYGNTSFTMNGTVVAWSVATTGNPTVTFGLSPSGTPTPAFLSKPLLVE